MKKFNVRWQLVTYDFVILSLIDMLVLIFYRNYAKLSAVDIVIQAAITFVSVFAARFAGGIYKQIWRYGGIQCYIRLLAVDACGTVLNVIAEQFLPITHVPLALLLCILSLNLLCSLTMRMMYRYAYKYASNRSAFGKLLSLMLRIFAGGRILRERQDVHHKIRIAIIGAGSVGVALAEELLSNDSAFYVPRCFVDISRDKVGRSIHGIPVLLENESILEQLKENEVQEIVFALPDLKKEDKNRLYNYYSKAGYKIKVYDYPLMQSAGEKRHLREFDIEELLFRKTVTMQNEKISSYYRDKVVLITGGGGSIGSELCRQLARMLPRQIIILDIYENGAYDVQQELKLVWGTRIDVKIEIVSITNKRGVERVFETYHPQIVINAAAHKHVPLMEHNCLEAVENNVFGTENLVELCEEYNAERFMMVSTDKAVNPTNVMGATKRMCEMIVQSAGVSGHVKYSATRFGNVLGSAGSVIPLFKKQISGGGPITITDKRIIRYFMTIPEAAQLVLQSGAMADNGELFVLDMGQPVKILDLAENMIRLVGAKDIEIVETGLRPGEKLYEELLVKKEDLDKTENDLIFIEREKPLDISEIKEKLEILKKACESNDDETVRAALKQVVPTYKDPEEVKAVFEEAEEKAAPREPAVV